MNSSFSGPTGCDETPTIVLVIPIDLSFLVAYNPKRYIYIISLNRNEKVINIKI